MNILIDGNDRTKIGDFGLATRDFFIRKTATGEHEKNYSLTKDIGTTLYMAPELFSDRIIASGCNTKLDVFR